MSGVGRADWKRRDVLPKKSWFLGMDASCEETGKRGRAGGIDWVASDFRSHTFDGAAEAG